MAIITLTSDFGHRDAYAAILKATILSKDPKINVVDISHDVDQSNIAQGAFIIGSAFRNFPENTIHIVAVDSLGTSDNKIIAAKIEGHFFIAADNGLLSLISELNPEKVVLISENGKSTFPSKDIMASAAVDLANGTMLEKAGSDYAEMKRFLKRSVRANEHAIIGHVVHIDHYGNLITNIKKEDFDTYSDGKSFIIRIGKEKIDSINYSPSEVEASDCFVLFNHLGVMEIGIKHGHAGKLLGLDYDSQILVKFN
ncbi:MAG: SAM-dependent chlorinase/fluorinase [Bacteroidota bacterium]